MIGQNADCDGFKRPALLHCSASLPEPFNLFEKKFARPFGENDREKENTAFGSTVLRHNESYHEAIWWARRKGCLCPPYNFRGADIVGSANRANASLPRNPVTPRCRPPGGWPRTGTRCGVRFRR